MKPILKDTQKPKIPQTFVHPDREFPSLPRGLFSPPLSPPHPRKKKKKKERGTFQLLTKKKK